MGEVQEGMEVYRVVFEAKLSVDTRRWFEEQLNDFLSHSGLGHVNRHNGRTSLNADGEYGTSEIELELRAGEEEWRNFLYALFCYPVPEGVRVQRVRDGKEVEVRGMLHHMYLYFEPEAELAQSEDAFGAFHRELVEELGALCVMQSSIYRSQPGGITACYLYVADAQIARAIVHIKLEDRCPEEHYRLVERNTELTLAEYFPWRLQLKYMQTYPNYWHSLKSLIQHPAPGVELARLRQAHPKIPPVLYDLLEFVNGTSGLRLENGQEVDLPMFDFSGLMHFALLSTSEILRREKGERDQLAKLLQEESTILRGPISRDVEHVDVIPFARGEFNGEEAMLYVDLHPAPEGNVGQVLCRCRVKKGILIDVLNASFPGFLIRVLGMGFGEIFHRAGGGEWENNPYFEHFFDKTSEIYWAFNNSRYDSLEQFASALAVFRVGMNLGEDEPPATQLQDARLFFPETTVLVYYTAFVWGEDQILENEIVVEGKVVEGELSCVTLLCVLTSQADPPLGFTPYELLMMVHNQLSNKEFPKTPLFKRFNFLGLFTRTSKSGQSSSLPAVVLEFEWV